MSVNSPPLGATRSGAFGLRTAPLEAGRTRTRAPVSRVGLLGLAGMLATGVLVSISAASTDKLLPQTTQTGLGPIGLAGSFGTTGINLGSIGLTVTVALMFASYVVTVGAARRLSPLLVLGSIAALHALILLAPPLPQPTSSATSSTAGSASCTAPTRIWPARTRSHSIRSTPTSGLSGPLSPRSTARYSPR